MKRFALSCGVILTASMGGEAVSAQVLSPQRLVTPVLEVGQRYPTGIQLSEAQRRGLRWGAQIGVFAGLGAAWWAWDRQQDDCVGLGWVGGAGTLALYIGVGMLGGMVAGGAVGLGVGTIVDDDGEARSAVELRFRIAP
jgi:hypothetical protein